MASIKAVLLRPWVLQRSMSYDPGPQAQFPLSGRCPKWPKNAREFFKVTVLMVTSDKVSFYGSLRLRANITYYGKRCILFLNADGNM